MMDEKIIRNQIGRTLAKTNYDFGERYQGKVRDNYTKGGKRIIISTDRVSAFDVVLDTIPFKGQVLNQIAEFWFTKTKNVAENHVIDVPDPNIMVVKLCKPFPVEVIVRGYITGSLWREYEKNQDNYGLNLPANLKKDQKLDEPIITPSTKAAEGHDMPMKKNEVLKIIPEEIYSNIEKMALSLYKEGVNLSGRQGLILVDTKYEFGMSPDGKILVIDEVHTPDSSRFWIKDKYQELFNKGKSQQMLDKEYIRQWLFSQGFTGEGNHPIITEEVKIEAAKRYIELYELMTGMRFEPSDGDIEERIGRCIKEIDDKNV
jgi:phosphoribosylaminoimidazole-succinocarboxamide synthase